MNSEYLSKYISSLSFKPNDVVLDIATGRKLLYKYKLDNVKKLIAVEPDAEWCSELIDDISDIPCATEINNCAYEDYTPIENIDVVVCAGLLYHLSSPIHFLQTVANVYQPKVFYLETTGVYDPDKELEQGCFWAQFNEEPVNKKGMSQGLNIAPYKLTMHLSFVVHIMETIGYKLENHTNLSTESQLSKESVTMFKFIRTLDSESI